MGVQTCALPISRTDDGLRLAAFYRPAAPGRKTILFFHGNGDNMIGAIEATREPGAAGHGLMLVEYRGDGGNPGSPGEAGLHRVGESSEEQTSGLQSLMRTSYDAFSLKTKTARTISDLFLAYL